MQNRHPIPPRRSATVDTHRAGHSSGLHPEDEPYLTDQRKRHPNNPLELADDLDYPDEPARAPTSARRWVTTEKANVYRQGNREIVLHDGPPKRRLHWAFIFWIGMLAMLACYLLWNWGNAWWTTHQLDATYGFPRTWQTDQVVGIDDSQSHPSHFIFENLAGHVLIIFLPGGDASHAKIYMGPQIFGENPSSLPVTGEFKDVGNGKVDMIVHIGGNQQIIYLNTGSDFKPQE
ncbi:MAG: hypothetical protein ACRDIV_10805 [Ktedonobacteraceae bacterium]